MTRATTLTEANKARARTLNYARRIRRMLEDLGASSWNGEEMKRFMNRVRYMTRYEGLTDRDLREMVRYYNREICGRRASFYGR